MQTCKYSTHYPSANQPVRPTRPMVGMTNSAPDKLCNSGPSQSATTTTVHQAHNTHNSSAQHYGTPASGDIAEQRTEKYRSPCTLGRPKTGCSGYKPANPVSATVRGSTTHGKHHTEHDNSRWKMTIARSSIAQNPATWYKQCSPSSSAWNPATWHCITIYTQQQCMEPSNLAWL